MENLYTIKEVKAIVRLSAMTIRKLIKLGTFPPPLRANVIKNLWRPCDIEDWINKNSFEE